MLYHHKIYIISPQKIIVPGEVARGIRKSRGMIEDDYLDEISLCIILHLGRDFFFSLAQERVYG